VQHQRHLEERRALGVPRWLERVHQPVERHVLVGEGAQRPLLHPAQQLAEGGVALQLRAQHQGVDEEANQPLQLRPGAARDGHAHAHVLLPRVARQQQLEARQQAHEQRGPFGAAEPAQHPRQPHRQLHLQHRARAVRPRRARPVGGQLQRGGRALQLPLPPGQLLLQHLPVQVLALPQGELGVLLGQLRQRRRAPLAEGLVQTGHLADEHRGGPAVGDDVVQRHQQQVFALVQPQQARAQQRAPRQVEGPARLLARQAQRLGLTLRERQVPQVLHGQPAGRRRVDDLHRPALARLEGGAQRLVAAHQRAEGALQRGGVHLALQPQGVRDVVERAARLVLVQEPQPLLRGGQLRLPLARHQQRARLAGRVHRAGRRIRVRSLAQRLHNRSHSRHVELLLEPSSTFDTFRRGTTPA
jgi:hypothetical protein